MSNSDATNSREQKVFRQRLLKLTKILAAVIEAKKPTDIILDDFFRENRGAGSTDRRFYRETVYGIIRKFEYLSYLISSTGESPSPTSLLICNFLRKPTGQRDLLIQIFDESVVEKFQRSIEQAERTFASLPVCAKINLPQWIIDYLPPRNLFEIADALNREASLDIRINPLKSDRAEISNLLQKQNIDYQPCVYSPLGIRINKKLPLQNLAIYKNGQIEIQDEGSQILGLIVDPEPGQTVIDFCAGAGGKSLLLSSIMNNYGNIFALDVNSNRLDRMQSRIDRNDAKNIRTVTIKTENDTKLKQWMGAADRVLVDAPCTGTGTLRRHPEIRFRHFDFPSLAKTQLSILTAAAKLVKSGGRLIYATCSILPIENESIIQSFLAENSAYTVVPVQPVLDKLSIPLSMESDILKLSPLEHDTDGFFACILQKS